MIDLVCYAGFEELSLLKQLEASPVVGELAIDVNELLDTKMVVGPKYTTLKLLVDADESPVTRHVKIHPDCHFKKLMLRPEPPAHPHVEIPKILRFFSIPSYIERLRIHKIDLHFHSRRRGVGCPPLSVDKLSLYYCPLRYNGPKAEATAPKGIECTATDVSLKCSSTKILEHFNFPNLESLSISEPDELIPPPEYDPDDEEAPLPPPAKIGHVFGNLDNLYIDVAKWEHIGRVLSTVNLENCPITSLVLSTTCKLSGDLSVLTRFTKLKNLQTVEIYNAVWANRNTRSDAQPVSIGKVYTVLEMLLPSCPALNRILFRETNSDKKTIDSLLLEASDLQTYREHMSKNNGRISYSLVAPISARGAKIKNIRPKELERDSESECELSVDEETFPNFAHPGLAFLLNFAG
ncbi:hypothetical protein TRICI_004756 [Trichomonascus ciferrii]|uniref:Uncharacterized protein n=1 Tax=Trichomonascus ciferrii TaxID=44093 RepID=A0A642UYY6_9ASCO|nr:hypothetical protein TRICI_004756 [Trichomonascus ciferrii]